MELGEKLRRARLDAGLTQKQLCEDIVTRNMLSQIENGTAKPSMKTLDLFARRLGKTVSYFLEDSAVLSPNTQVMENARQCYDREDFSGTLENLTQYREPDRVYDREMALLKNLCLLELAAQAIRDGKEAYAKELLGHCSTGNTYCSKDLEHRRLLLLGSIKGENVLHLLPSVDEELLLRAKEALKTGQFQRAGALLDACENQQLPSWQLLRGKVWLQMKQYELARRCLCRAEQAYPKETASALEICYRELGDYQNAYLYACKQRT